MSEKPILSGRGATAVAGIFLVIVGVGTIFASKETGIGIGLSIFGAFLIWFANR